MPPAEGAPSPAQAFTLGLLQGPTELLPISSSAHTTLLPWLAGWSYTRLPGTVRKDFEVALHAGAGLALAIRMRRELARELRQAGPRGAPALAIAVAIPALAGLALQGPVERRLGGPCSIAAGLVLGSGAMLIADAAPPEGCGEERDLGWRDGLALGLAQAAALAPGVSRNGATLSAARLRGFSRARAQSLSWLTGLPVIVGPVLLRARASAAREERARALLPAALGAGAAFVSSFLSAGAIRSCRVREAPLLGYAAYRCALATIVAVRLRRAQ
jgi:undecaprenyl-diphosphatase